MRRFSAAVVALLLLALVPAARADFDVQFFTDAALTNKIYQINDQGLGDSDFNLGQISANTFSDLVLLNSNVASTGIRFSSLAAATDAPLAGDVARLLVGGAAQLTPGSTVGDLYILVSADDYFAPAGPYRIGSSASHTFTDIASGTAPTFQSFFNDNNVLNGRLTPTGLLSFAPPNGDKSLADDAPFLLAPGSVPYSLSNVTHLHLTGDGLTAVDQFLGSTTVRAVPEPGSLALLGLGGSALALLQRRRQRRRLATA